MNQTCPHYDTPFVERNCFSCGGAFHVCPICCPADHLCGNLFCEARALRERIYGPISDTSWESVKDAWAADIQFLRDRAQFLPAL